MSKTKSKICDRGNQFKESKITKIENRVKEKEKVREKKYEKISGRKTSDN